MNLTGASKMKTCSMPDCNRYALEWYRSSKVCCHCKQVLIDEVLRVESQRIDASQMVMHKRLRSKKVGGAI